MQTSTRKRILAAAIAAMLLVGSASAVAAGDGMDSSRTDSMSKDGMVKDTSDTKSATLTVEDQTVSEDTVVIASLYVPRDGFLVIHAADADGEIKAPQSIGHQMIKQGSHAPVKVKLDEPVKSGDILFAMLHEDTDTRGQFEFAESGGQKDGAMKADGKPVIKSFMVH